MRPDEREAAWLHASLPSYQRKLRSALALIAHVRAQHGGLFVAFSGGRDSSVLLSLVRQVDPAIEARISLRPASQVLDDLPHVLTWWRKQGQLIRESHQWCDNVVDIVAGAASHWVALHHLRAELGTGALLGLRKQESRERRRSLTRFGPVHRYETGPLAGAYRVAPLANWDWRDVAARIATHELPLRERGPTPCRGPHSIYPDAAQWA